MGDTMSLPFQNLVFSGAGVLGIAYIGVLDYLDKIRLLPQIQRLAGASAGAITCCLTSFNLPFEELKQMSDSLDYSKIPGKDEPSKDSRFTKQVKAQLDKVFDNIDCVYRLINNYGWYSSAYFYDWIKEQIASQFNQTKKEPPYTFEDFKNSEIHKNQRPFKDLYIIGTDLCNSNSCIFSFENTPKMEVAEAVRISMSVPLFFESCRSSCCPTTPNGSPQIFVDGGLLYNFPIDYFDKIYPKSQTLGTFCEGYSSSSSINNLIDFISYAISCSTKIQSQIYNSNPANLERSIKILTSDISALNFNIKTNDDTYRFLYNQGYTAAEVFFSLRLP